jgi:hypothetical protein
MEAAEELSNSAREAPVANVTAAWRVDVLRPSRQVQIRARSRTQATRVNAQATRPKRSELDYRARALALWPRLDPQKLRRTRGDVMRIARLVERRTACSLETIIGMLRREERAPD